jgi:RNA polymerase sigma-70 factor (ECF subfamily)
LSPEQPDGQTLGGLAARAQLGDRAALEILLRRLQGPLQDHIEALMRDDDAAADVLQETLWIVCRRLATVRETDWVRAWAYRVATRQALRAMRKAGRVDPERIEDIPAGYDAGIEEAVDEAVLDALPGRLAALPPAAQTVLRMHYLQSLTQQEVAEALEIPLGTVKSRISYGLQLLRRNWAP